MFYSAQVDDLGVLCVDHLSDEREWTAEDVAKLAVSYPDMIYFEVSRNTQPFSAPIQPNRK